MQIERRNYEHRKIGEDQHITRLVAEDVSPLRNRISSILHHVVRELLTGLGGSNLNSKLRGELKVKPN